MSNGTVTVGSPARRRWFYKGLLIAATLIWGSSFVLMKDAVEVLAPATLIGVRFTIAAALLTIVLWRSVRAVLNPKSLTAGLVLGGLFFLAYWTQTIGLEFTTPGKNAFLTGTYCAIVPFAYWAIGGGRPRVAAVVSAAVCVVGIGFVSLSNETLTIGFGDLMTLVCAVFFAFHIVFVTRFSANHNVLGLTVLQFWVGGLAGLALGLTTEPLPAVAQLTPLFWLNIAFLAVFATAVALVFQNVALKYVPPAQASLFLSLESVFGVVFSVIFYGEVLTAPLVTGFALIFGAILLSELSSAKADTTPGHTSAGNTTPGRMTLRVDNTTPGRRARGMRGTPEAADLLAGDGAAAVELAAELDLRTGTDDVGGVSDG